MKLWKIKVWIQCTVFNQAKKNSKGGGLWMKFSIKSCPVIGPNHKHVIKYWPLIGGEEKWFHWSVQGGRRSLRTMKLKFRIMKFRGLLYLCVRMDGWVRRKGSVANFKSLEFYSFNINLLFWSFNSKIRKEIIRMCMSKGGGVWICHWEMRRRRCVANFKTIEFYYFNINLLKI